MMFTHKGVAGKSVGTRQALDANKFHLEQLLEEYAKKQIIVFVLSF